MANGWGGYRQPTNAAPVSGPGALSRRTDGPLRGPVPAPPTPDMGGAAGGLGIDTSGLTPLDAPTQRPDEPVTAGAATGPGRGPVVPPEQTMDPQTAERLRSYLPVFIILASNPDADSATRQYVRQLRAELG